MSSFDIYPATGEEAEKIAFLMILFNQRRTRRANFEVQWEESAALAWPEYMSSFFYGRDIAPGYKRTQFQIDSSVSVASHRFGAIADWLLTPSNMLWSKIEASDKDLMKQRPVAEWCKKVTDILWRERYRSTANFIGQNQQNMQSLGVFGNMGMFIDELDGYLDPDDRGLRYLGLPVGEIYLETDHQRRVVGFIRHFRLTAQQFKTRWPQKSIPMIEAALMISSQQLFDILHFVRPRSDYNPKEMFSTKGKKFQSIYLSVQGHCILEEGGYRTLPLAYGRYMQAPDEDYGRGPMQMVLAAAKTKNAQKRIFLKQGHRAGDPAYLVSDTGLIDLKTQSGAWNPGGMNKDGKPLVGILPTGEIQITKEMMEEEGQIINDAFLVSLFKLILDNPDGQPNARQVVEYINERGVLLHPTIGRQCSEYLGPTTDRELDILSYQGKLPPMPAALKEAAGDVEITYTNAISMAVLSQQSAGYARTMEFAGEAVKATGDASLFDIFDFDTAIPEIGDQNYAPVTWFATKEQLAAKRKQRAQDAERERQVKELPGKAAIIKAQAIQSKAATGGNTGGTLSGQEPTAMPGVPNQQGQVTNNQGFGGPQPAQPEPGLGNG